MTFATVLLVCLAGIAGCAALVFLVETIVAFCLHDTEEVPHLANSPISIDRVRRHLAHDLRSDVRVDKAA